MNISTPSSPSQIAPCENYLPSVVALAEQGEWEPFGFDVDYCLSENVPETCSYSGSVPILIVVIVCNALKVIVMLVTAFRLRGNSLITIGDAIESFLYQPDESTRGSCLLSRSDVSKMKFASWKRKTASYRLRTLTANLQSFCWWRAASIRRWSFTLLFTGFNLAFTGGLLALALNAIYKVGLSIVSLGVGRLNGGAIIQGGFVGSGSSPSSQIIGSIIIANLPQAILSFIYLHLNGLLTTMFLASEYFGYVRDRKGLRVSTPKPDTSQRSTYFLQLPYRIRDSPHGTLRCPTLASIPEHLPGRGCGIRLYGRAHFICRDCKLWLLASRYDPRARPWRINCDGHRSTGIIQTIQQQWDAIDRKLQPRYQCSMSCSELGPRCGTEACQMGSRFRFGAGKECGRALQLHQWGCGRC